MSATDMLILLNEDHTLNKVGTKANLLSNIPKLGNYPVDQMLNCAEQVLTDIQPGKRKKPQHLWLFFLAGRLQGLVSEQDRKRDEVILDLAPFAWALACLLRANGFTQGKNRIDWDDYDAVEMEFIQAWTQRKLPVNSDALQVAYDVAKSNPLNISGNKYFALVVNMGYTLQRINPEFPFLLPVNNRVATLLGTTVPTVGSAVAKAIRDGYFIVENSKYSASTKRARRFIFNDPLQNSDEKPVNSFPI